MLRDAAVTIIKRGLGFRTGTSLDTAIIDALQEEQMKREAGVSLPWFLLQEDQTIAVAADDDTYALPTGFLKEDIDRNPVTLTDSNGVVVVLDPLAYDDAKRLYETGAAGIPEVYCVRKSDIVLFPKPDAAHTLTWSYYKAADLLTTNIENAWLASAPYVLISGAGLTVAKDLRDQAGTAIFQSRAQIWSDWLTRQMTAHREANERFVVGKYA